MTSSFLFLLSLFFYLFPVILPGLLRSKCPLHGLIQIVLPYPVRMRRMQGIDHLQGNLHTVVVQYKILHQKRNNKAIQVNRLVDLVLQIDTLFIFNIPLKYHLRL